MRCRNRWLSVMFPLAAMMISCLPVHAKTYSYARVVTETQSLVMRDAPMDGEIIAQLPVGSVCRVLETGFGDDGNWTKVFSGGFTGYAHSYYLNDALDAMRGLESMEGVLFQTNANIYSQPSSSSKVICERNRGATEEFADTPITADGWTAVTIHVGDKSVIGWAENACIDTGNIVPDAEPAYSEEEIRYILGDETDVQEEEILIETDGEEEMVIEDTAETGSGLETEVQETALQEAANALVNGEQAKEAPAASVTGSVQGVTTASGNNPPVSENKWNGQRLTRTLGTITGPSGKETYYNLDMSSIVSSIKNHTWVWNDIAPQYKDNVSGDYYIRNDGAKMLGNYIMVAADFGVHPRGSLVQTSLGTGVVVDTGEFAATNRNQIDIAMNW